ncbi:type II toxin-antitoxin system RelE/ParE family toxin [Candidatus Pacearchaeota archaeon]|nr:type II toxin-antitoxin system RelE/ParE family toxin [Candidatus Pacearchaeota archaeon]
MYEIIFRNPAKRFIKGLSKDSQIKILKQIEKLGKNPRIGKHLTGNLRGLFRLRFDNFRIVYKFNNYELIVYVLNIGDRGSVYNK